MYTNTLLSLCKYSDYANQLLLAEANKLSKEELERQSSPSHASVWKLLCHMFYAEFFFFIAPQGREVGPERPDINSMDELNHAWRQMAAQREDYVETLSEQDIAEPVAFPMGPATLTLPRYQLMLQGLLHSHHHRGELSVVMTGLGYPLPTLDSIIYFVRESGQTWPFE
jgi:uncharacterized damage-inducible protein DinB